MVHAGPCQSLGEDGQAPAEAVPGRPGQGSGREAGREEKPHSFGETVKVWTVTVPLKGLAWQGGGIRAPRGAPSLGTRSSLPTLWSCRSPEGRPSPGRWAPARPRPEAPKTGLRGAMRGRGLRDPHPTALGSCLSELRERRGPGSRGPKSPQLPPPLRVPCHMGPSLPRPHGPATGRGTNWNQLLSLTDFLYPQNGEGPPRGQGLSLRKGHRHGVRTPQGGVHPAAPPARWETSASWARRNLRARRHTERALRPRASSPAGGPRGCAPDSGQ